MGCSGFYARLVISTNVGIFLQIAFAAMHEQNGSVRLLAE